MMEKENENSDLWARLTALRQARAIENARRAALKTSLLARLSTARRAVAEAQDTLAKAQAQLRAVRLEAAETAYLPPSLEERELFAQLKAGPETARRIAAHDRGEYDQ